MDMAMKKPQGKVINFTLDGKKAVIAEAKDLFGNPVITLIIDGEYIGAYDLSMVFDIDQVHEYLLKDSSFKEEAYS